jgi:hypothetical protein
MRRPTRGAAPWLLACLLCGDGWTREPLPTAVPNGPVYKAAPVQATASSSERGSNPSSVFDYDTAGSGWNAGGFAPQWLQIDLGSLRIVSEIRLSVTQHPDGNTSHRVLTGAEAASLRPVASLAANTMNGQTITLAIPQAEQRAVRYVRIETSASPSWVAWGKIEVWARATNVPDWFGYYGDSFSWLTDSTREILDHVNISWVGTDLGSLPTLPARVRAASDRGLRVALAVPQELFFTKDFGLRRDYRRRWKAFAAQIAPLIGHVAMILPIDEPYSQAKIIGVSARAIKWRLETIGALIKGSFPRVPIAFTLSAIDFDTQQSAFANLGNPIPAQFDWIGFDCYGSWGDCGEPAFRAVHSIPWYFDQIEAKLASQQRIFLFPDGFLRQGDPADPDPDPDRDEAEVARRINRADQFLQLALSESRTVGMFVFLYQDDYVEESRRFLGVRHWPMLQKKFRGMGRTITGK